MDVADAVQSSDAFPRRGDALGEALQHSTEGLPTLGLLVQTGQLFENELLVRSAFRRALQRCQALVQVTQSIDEHPAHAIAGHGPHRRDPPSDPLLASTPPPDHANDDGWCAGA